MTLDDGTRIELTRDQFWKLLCARGSASEFIVGENHGESCDKLLCSLWPELVESAVLREIAGQGPWDDKRHERWRQWTKRPIPGTHADWRYLAHWVKIDAPKDVTDEWIEGELLPALTAKKQREAEQVAAGILPQQVTEAAANDSGKPDAGAGTIDEQHDRFVWKADGELFVIRFDGETGRFRKSLVGFQRYRQVLQSRNGRVKMAELLGADRDERVTNDINRSSDLSMDNEGLAALASQLQNLRAEQVEARSAGDLDKVVDCEEKIKQIEDWLNKQTRPAAGEDGERRRVARKLANPVDRMRTTILDSFHEARKKLIEGGMPNLAGHLEANVRSENDEIVYSLSGAVTWGFA